MRKIKTYLLWKKLIIQTENQSTHKLDQMSNFHIKSSKMRFLANCRMNKINFGTMQQRITNKTGY